MPEGSGSLEHALRGSSDSGPQPYAVSPDEIAAITSAATQNYALAEQQRLEAEEARREADHWKKTSQREHELRVKQQAEAQWRFQEESARNAKAMEEAAASVAAAIAKAEDMAKVEAAPITWE